MFRTAIITLTLGILLFITAMPIAADEPWFDPEKCAFCKQIAAPPGLMDHMKTTYHDLHNGLLSITHIDSAYQSAFKNPRWGWWQL